MDSLVKFLKCLVWACLVAIPFIVFIVDSGQIFPFITGKNFAFRFLVEISFGSWLILAFLREEFRPRRSILLLAITLFVAVMLVAGLMGVEVKQSLWSNFERMDGWITLAHLFAYTLVFSGFLFNRKRWDVFWNATIFASMGVGLFSLAQILREYLVDTLGYPADKGLPSILPIVNQGGDRIDATFGNATYLAVYMMLHVFVTLVMLLRYRSISVKLRVLYITALVLQVVSLYYTATRGAILGLLGGILLVSILFILFEDRGTKIKKVSVGVVVLTVFLVSGFLVLKDSDFVRGQQTLGRLASISLTDGTSGTRFLMWDVAWQGVKERPILGYGQGNFNYVFNRYYDPKLYNQEPWFDRAHNVIFDWLIAGGFIGLFSYLFIFGALIKLLVQSENFSRREKIIYIGMLSAYFFQNLFVFDQIGSYMVFFAFLAYVHSVESKDFLLESMFNIDSGLRNRVVVPIIILLTISTPFIVNADGYRQSRTAIKALSVGQASTVEELNENVRKVKSLFEKSIGYDSFGTAEVRERLPDVALQIAKAPQVENSLKQDFVSYTKEELDKQIEGVPSDTRYYLLMGDFLMRFGVFEESIENLEKAIELSPRKQGLYIQLGRVYGLMDDFDNMVKYMKKGYEIYEGNDQAWQAYVLSAKVSGQEDLYDSLIRESWEQGKYKRVSDYLQGRLAIDGDDPNLRYLLAVNFAKWGMDSRAVENLEHLVNKYPGQFAEQARSIIERIQRGEAM